MGGLCLWPPISCMNGGKFQRRNEESSPSDQLERRKGPCTNDVSTQGGGGVSQLLTIGGGGCVISILKILTWGGGSKIPKITMTSFVHGP